MNKALQVEPRKGGNIKMVNRKVTPIGYMLIAVFIIFIGFFTVHSAIAQTALSTVTKESSKSEEAAKKPVTPAGPADEYDRGNPRSSLKGYFKATRDGDYKRAAQYLDMRNLPGWMAYIEASELARQLKIFLDRTLWVDLELVSTNPEGNRQDGLHTKRESIGRIKVEDQTIDIIMLYWYHPPAYWDFLAFNQRVNTRVMREFEKEGIKFALPSTTTYLTQDDGQPLHLGIAGDSHLTANGASA
jgi:hypothetical protein